MEKTNIENLIVYRDRGIYGYTVRYKTGRRKSECTGTMLILPKTIHEFMKKSTYSISHDDNILNYHEVIYYNRDVRT